MINYSNDFKHFVYALSNDDKLKYISKWEPVFKSKIPIYIKYVNEKISLFLEFYSYIETINNSYAFYDKYEFNTPNSLNIIIEEILNYLDNSMFSKLKINYEYINIFTGKKGYMLENDIKFENGEILNKKIIENIEKDLKIILDERIEYILNPEYRKNIIRTKKLNRILNN
jgi:hypothetical protein